MSIQTYGIDDLWAGGKKLADLELADPPRGFPLPFPEVECPGACLWGVVHGKGPQLLNHLFHSSNPDLIRVYPYKGDAIVPILYGVFYPNQQVSTVAVGFLHVPPDLKAAYREQFCLGMTGEF